MEKKSTNLNQIKVKDIMAKDVITIDSKEELSRAARIMTKNNIHSLVVTQDGKAKYRISSFDLLNAIFLESFSGDLEFIKSEVLKFVSQEEFISISSEDTVQVAMEIFTEKNVRSLPVIDDEVLVGIITIMDVAKKIMGK